MKLALRVASVLALLVGTTPLRLNAQSPCRAPGMILDPPFTCLPHAVEDALAGTIISGCADTLRLCMGKPLAGKHPDAPISSPVRLYRLGPDGVHGTDQELLAVHWQLDTARGSIVIVPDPPLPVHDLGDPRPIVYRLVTDCEFWNGPGADTTALDIWKQHVAVVRGTARSTRTTEDITAQVIMQPSATAVISVAADGVFLSAEDTERYAFDHWTTTASGINVKPHAAEQYVVGGCWPLEDTVEFTAWYRDRTSGTIGSSVSQTDSHIAVRLQNGSAHISSHDKTTPIASIGITDLHGRLYLIRTYSGNTCEVHIPLWGPPGCYLLSVICGNSVTTHPLLVTPQ